MVRGDRMLALFQVSVVLGIGYLVFIFIAEQFNPFKYLNWSKRRLSSKGKKVRAGIHFSLLTILCLSVLLYSGEGTGFLSANIVQVVVSGSLYLFFLLHAYCWSPRNADSRSSYTDDLDVDISIDGARPASDKKIDRPNRIPSSYLVSEDDPSDFLDMTMNLDEILGIDKLRVARGEQAENSKPAHKKKSSRVTEAKP